MAGIQVSKALAYAVLTPPAGVSVEKAVLYIVLNAPNNTPPLWGSWTFPSGVVGIAYSQSWDMPASAEVVTYSVLSGALPGGLALTAGAHNVAQISGTPTVAGVFAFTLRAVNSAGTADKAFSITITAAPSANYGYTS